MTMEDNSELNSIFEEAAKFGLKKDDVYKALQLQNQTQKKGKSWVLFILSTSLFLLIAVRLNYFEGISLYELSKTLEESPCLLEQNPVSMEMSRALANCNMCQSLNGTVLQAANISKREFVEVYAYSGRPLIVTDAISNWSALEVFNFNYFKKLYDETKNSFEVSEGCQFFPYRTDFRSLKDALNMTLNRSLLQEDNWYFGWSNCDPVIMNKLREHYTVPYFIPQESESSQLDWIFMGGTGIKGADMHVDAVDRPSWQAQISGKKTWTLVPPPECESVCHTLNITVSKGDTVIVDTNQWFHSTYIHPGEISITIGSEYD